MTTDLPAGRKCCGFLSFSANLGCSRCLCQFSTGTFGANNYSGFNRNTWTIRSKTKHLDDIKRINQCTTKTMRKGLESELGCRYTVLLNLPYFNPIKMLTIDPMHNLYLGTAKHIFHKIWIAGGVLKPTDLIEIDSRISALLVYPNVALSSLPPDMAHSKSFTAEQWLIWVNYYSIFCLFEVHQFECWRHFVLASRILCKKNLSASDMTLADALLIQFGLNLYMVLRV